MGAGQLPVPAGGGDQGGITVREGEVPHPVGVVGQGNRQRRMDQRVVPGAQTVLGVAEVDQALAGAARAQPVPQPDQAHGQVGHGPGDVVGEQPAHPARDENVGFG